MRRTGEFSRMQLERDYPFQVAFIPIWYQTSTNSDFIRAIALRTKTMLLGGTHRVVVCFGK